ncbi:MAG: phage antirepressor KilAC domain-containing protein [Chrysiogenia bacterium]
MKKQNENQEKGKIVDGSQYIQPEDCLAIARNYLGSDTPMGDCFEFFDFFIKAEGGYSLQRVAEMLKLPGGEGALLQLLLGGGFLTGAFMSKNAHLPYKHFIFKGYFLVKRSADYQSRDKSAIFITQKGLQIILKKLQEFGIYLPKETK